MLGIRRRGPNRELQGCLAVRGAGKAACVAEVEQADTDAEPSAANSFHSRMGSDFDFLEYGSARGDATGYLLQTTGDK